MSLVFLALINGSGPENKQQIPIHLHETFAHNKCYDFILTSSLLGINQIRQSMSNTVSNGSICLVADDPRLLCREMAESRQSAAGLSSRDRTRHARSACYKDVFYINIFVIVTGVILALLALGEINF